MVVAMAPGGVQIGPPKTRYSGTDTVTSQWVVPQASQAPTQAHQAHAADWTLVWNAFCPPGRFWRFDPPADHRTLDTPETAQAKEAAAAAVQ